MNELIPVDFSADRLTVSARALHGFLDVNTPYHKWFPRMCEYGFTENQDYSVMDIFVHHSQGGSQSKKDAALTIDMAKEICMIQRNEKGKQARRYFLQLEKEWNSPEKVMARALRIADAKIKGLEADKAALQKEIAAFAPVKSYYEQILSSMGTMTTTQIAADYGISARELNRILHDERIQWKTNGQWVLYREYMGKGYTQSVTIPIVRSDGTPDTKLHTQWTQKGRLLIHDILTRRGIRANVDLEAGA